MPKPKRNWLSETEHRNLGVMSETVPLSQMSPAEGLLGYSYYDSMLLVQPVGTRHRTEQYLARSSVFRGSQNNMSSASKYVTNCTSAPTLQSMMCICAYISPLQHCRIWTPHSLHFSQCPTKRRKEPFSNAELRQREAKSRSHKHFLSPLNGNQNPTRRGD